MFLLLKWSQLLKLNNWVSLMRFTRKKSSMIKSLLSPHKLPTNLCQLFWLLKKQSNKLKTYQPLMVLLYKENFSILYMILKESKKESQHLLKKESQTWEIYDWFIRILFIAILRSIFAFIKSFIEKRRKKFLQ